MWSDIQLALLECPIFGFVISVSVFIIYWSLILTNGTITERIGENRLRFFGSVPRIVVTHCMVSLVIGCPSLILDPASALDYLMTNLIAMPGFLIAGVYVLRSSNVDLQLALWRYPGMPKKAALDTSQFVHDLSRLVQRTNNIHSLESFFRAYIDTNPTMTPVLRTAMQELEAENKIPTDL